MKPVAFLIIILGAFTLYSCNSNNDANKSKAISPEQVIIEGEVENNGGNLKTGSLTHFNALLRSGEDEIFSIDSLGKFKLSYELLMPTPTNIVIIGGHMTYLYLVPGGSYNLTLKETGEFELHGTNAFLNDQFRKLGSAVGNAFRDQDRKRMNLVRADSISYEDYCIFLKNRSDKKIDFINLYCDSSRIDPSIRTMFLTDALYEQAWARILYRMIFLDDGRVIFRESLPQGFYSDILSEFPINNSSAASSKFYMDYISNILSSILDESMKDTLKLSTYLQENSTLNKTEINLLTREYLRDSAVFKMDGYQQLIKEKSRELEEISRKYSIAYLIDTLPSFEPGLGRDILMSQGIDNYSFNGSYLPINETNWKKIKNIIYNSQIYELLRRLDNIEKAKMSKSLGEGTSLRDPILAKSSKEFYNQLFDNYKGKYVYVDFWATWCGPCRSELPVSMLLQKEFRDKNIVFLYLCCASEKTSWENYIKAEQLSGEHYFITTDEQNFLSSYFEIRGYPTYAIVGPEGKLLDNNPPRPISQNIVRYLEDLIH